MENPYPLNIPGTTRKGPEAKTVFVPQDYRLETIEIGQEQVNAALASYLTEQFNNGCYNFRYDRLNIFGDSGNQAATLRADKAGGYQELLGESEVKQMTGLSDENEIRRQLVIISEDLEKKAYEEEKERRKQAREQLQ